jgi:hypothetical protein
MPSRLNPQLVLGIYWLVIILFAAFFLRQACSLCHANMPRWRRAIISVVLVTFLAYLAFDFTSYLIMRSLDGVVLRVPPWYGYNYWFREPFALKWLIISQVGPIRYLPIVFALCTAGILQVLVLEGDVTFGWGFLIVFIQTLATVVSSYILSLVLGSVLQSAGLTLEGPPVAVTPPGQQAAAQARPAGGRMRQLRGQKRNVARGSGQGVEAAGQTPEEQNSLHLLEKKVESATGISTEYAKNAAGNLKDYADSQLEQLEEDLAPVTKRLPEPVQNFLARGGWWVVLGICAFIVLLWLRSILHRLGRGITKARRPKKKARTKDAGLRLKENLGFIGTGFTEGGPQEFTVNGLPARLRLVVLSMANRTGGELSEEMADRVLDWIKTGFAQVASYDQPGVRVWPPFYSPDGFAAALAANIRIPEPAGMKSHWVQVAGRVKMGRVGINVGLLMYTPEPSNLRLIKVRGERWLNVLGVAQSPEFAGRR